MAFIIVRLMLLAQLGDELSHVRQEIEERGNSMSDGGNVTEMLLLIFVHQVYFKNLIFNKISNKYLTLELLTHYRVVEAILENL